MCVNPQYYLKKMTSMYCQMVLIFLNKGIYDNSCPTKKLALLYHLLQKMISHTLRNVSILNVMFNCILRGINRCEQKYTLRALLFIYGHLHVCIGFSLIVGWDSWWCAVLRFPFRRRITLVATTTIDIVAAHTWWHTTMMTCCNCQDQEKFSRRKTFSEKKLPASLPWLWGVTVPTAGILSNMDSTDWALLALELKLACVKLCFCFNLRVSMGTSPTSSSNPVVAEMVLGNLSILCSCSLKM